MKEIFLPFIISLIAGLSTLIGYLFIYIKPSKTSDFIGTSLAFSMTIMMIISITDLIPEGFFYLKKEYNQYINIVSKLVEELSLKDNSISMALIISALIESSTFSYCSFTKDSCEDILISKLGLNILKSTGCCRDVSAFINDIFNSNSFNYIKCNFNYFKINSIFYRDAKENR